MISTEKPGSPAELVHFGVKGMQWGVRKERTPQEAADISAKRKKIAKKAAIGVGTAAVVAGTAFVGYKLKTGGHIPVSDISRAAENLKRTEMVTDFLSKTEMSPTEAAEAQKYAEMFLKNAKG